MVHITLWSGYVSTVDALIRRISFSGERLGGLEYTVDGRAVERAFYRVDNGLGVVHEVRFGDGEGYRCDQARVYIYPTADDAFESLSVNPQSLDANRTDVSATRITAQETRELSYTLNEYIDEFEICITHPFA